MCLLSKVDCDLSVAHGAMGGRVMKYRAVERVEDGGTLRSKVLAKNACDSTQVNECTSIPTHDLVTKCLVVVVGSWLSAGWLVASSFGRSFETCTSSSCSAQANSSLTAATENSLSLALLDTVTHRKRQFLHTLPRRHTEDPEPPTLNLQSHNGVLLAQSQCRRRRILSAPPHLLRAATHHQTLPQRNLQPDHLPCLTSSATAHLPPRSGLQQCHLLLFAIYPLRPQQQTPPSKLLRRSDTISSVESRGEDWTSTYNAYCAKIETLTQPGHWQ